MSEMCLRFDLAVARAAILLLDGIDKDTVEKNDLLQAVKTIEELEQLRSMVKVSLMTIEAAIGFRNMPLPDPAWEKPSWAVVSSPEEIAERRQTLHQSQAPGLYPVAEGT